MKFMKELNPNHPVTQELHDHWHKLAALLMHKFGRKSVQISVEDMARLEEDWPNGVNIVARPKDDVITLFLVNDAEAVKLAKEEGGLLV